LEDLENRERKENLDAIPKKENQEDPADLDLEEKEVSKEIVVIRTLQSSVKRESVESQENVVYPAFVTIKQSLDLQPDPYKLFQDLGDTKEIKETKENQERKDLQDLQDNKEELVPREREEKGERQELEAHRDLEVIKVNVVLKVTKVRGVLPEPMEEMVLQVRLETLVIVVLMALKEKRVSLGSVFVDPLDVMEKRVIKVAMV